MTRVFITGIAGLLGSHLADAYLEKGFDVAGNDSLFGGYRENVPAGAEFYHIDCNERGQLRKAMAGSDIVYHTAALAYEGLSVVSPAQINYGVNQTTASVLSVAADVGIDRFVFCSSMSRYGDQTPPFSEEMETNPKDPYAVSKVAAEEMTALMADIYDFEYSIAVPHNIIGPRQKINDPFRNVAAIFMNRMLSGKQPIIYGDGSQKRCFSFIQDAVRPLAKMGTWNNVVSETVNIGPDEEFVSINELAEIIADIFDFDLDPIYVDKRPQEVELAYCSSDKARRLLDYQTAYSLRDGLEEMAAWVQTIGPREFEYHLDLEIQTEMTPDTWQDRLI